MPREIVHLHPGNGRRDLGQDAPDSAEDSPFSQHRRGLHHSWRHYPCLTQIMAALQEPDYCSTQGVRIRPGRLLR